MDKLGLSGLRIEDRTTDEPKIVVDDHSISRKLRHSASLGR